MRSALLSALLAFASVISSGAVARGSSHSGSFHPGITHPTSHSSSSHRSSARHSVTRAYLGVKRDSHGKIARDPHAKEAFCKSHPCPSTGKRYGKCPGYVVDHIRALKRGGADDPSNMQWQTRQAARGPLLTWLQLSDVVNLGEVPGTTCFAFRTGVEYQV